MNTIERYIFKRMLIASIGSTALIVALVWISQALTQINFATNSGGSITALVHFMGLLVPQFFTAVLPFSLVVGIVQVLNTMNMDSEMPVLASAGYGRWSVARPVMLLCGSAAAYVFVSSHFIEPYTNARSGDVAMEARGDLLKTLIREGRFTKLDDKLTIFVEKKTAEGLEGIMISDARDPNLDLLQFAKTGAVAEIDGGSILVLNDGQIQRKTPEAKDVTIIRFQSYAISLAQFTQANGSSNYSVKQRPSSYLLNPDPNDNFLKKSPGEAPAEFHRRMSDWLYLILVGLVALVLAAKPRSHRGGHFVAYILSFGSMLMYRGLSGVAHNMNKSVADHVWAFYAVPILGIGLCLTMYATGRTIEMPQFLLGAYDKITEGIKNKRLTWARRGNA